MPTTWNLAPQTGGVTTWSLNVFQPDELSDLLFWLKADHGVWKDTAETMPVTNDGDDVAAWQDIPGGNDPKQSTTLNQPVIQNSQSNGLPAVLFSSVGPLWLSAGNVSALNFERTDPFTIVVMVRVPVLLTSGIFLAKELNVDPFTGWYCQFNRVTGGFAFLMEQDSTHLVDVQATGTMVQPLQYYTYLVRNSGVGNASGISMRLNGVNQTLFTANDGLTGSIKSSAAFTLGSRDAGGQALLSYIAEAAIYNREITLAECQQVEAYFRKRYAHY